MKKGSIIGIAAMAAMFSFTITSTTQAADPAVKCESGKLKEAGKYASCRMKADSKAVKKGEMPDYTKCESKFSDKWSKTESKADGACPSNGDEEAVEAAITTCMGDVATGIAGGPPCAGEEVGGACWFLGAAGDSCDDTCNGLGLLYDPATDGFGAASADNCNAVMDALGDVSTPWVGPPVICFVPLGCHATGGSRVLCDGASAEAQTLGAERACACML
jgi:hypothetical protein